MQKVKACRKKVSHDRYIYIHCFCPRIYAGYSPNGRIGLVPSPPPSLRVVNVISFIRIYVYS